MVFYPHYHPSVLDVGAQSAFVCFDFIGALSLWISLQDALSALMRYLHVYFSICVIYLWVIYFIECSISIFSLSALLFSKVLYLHGCSICIGTLSVCWNIKMIWKVVFHVWIISLSAWLLQHGCIIWFCAQTQKLIVCNLGLQSTWLFCM